MEPHLMCWHVASEDRLSGSTFGWQAIIFPTMVSVSRRCAHEVNQGYMKNENIINKMSECHHLLCY